MNEHAITSAAQRTFSFLHVFGSLGFGLFTRLRRRQVAFAVPSSPEIRVCVAPQEFDFGGRLS